MCLLLMVKVGRLGYIEITDGWARKGWMDGSSGVAGWVK